VKGALRIGGRTVDYYSIAAGSFDLQIGGQRKNVIICFMEEDALKNFSLPVPAGKVGAEGSASGDSTSVQEPAVDSTQTKESIFSVHLGQTGLMANATIEGALLTKIVR